jgi:hypothetical protein
MFPPLLLLVVACSSTPRSALSGPASLRSLTDCPDPFLAYYDADGDGWGDARDALELCEPAQGFVTNYGDCDPLDFDVFPGAIDSCGDARDQDCTGADASCAASLGPESASIILFPSADLGVGDLSFLDRATLYLADPQGSGRLFAFDPAMPDPSEALTADARIASIVSRLPDSGFAGPIALCPPSNQLPTGGLLLAEARPQRRVESVEAAGLLYFTTLLQRDHHLDPATDLSIWWGEAATTTSSEAAIGSLSCTTQLSDSSSLLLIGLPDRDLVYFAPDPSGLSSRIQVRLSALADGRHIQALEGSPRGAFGTDVAFWDIEGDGINEIMISEPSGDLGFAAPGVLWLMPSEIDELIPLVDQATRLTNPFSDPGFGRYVSSVDADGDGYPELVLPEPSTESSAFLLVSPRGVPPTLGVQEVASLGLSSPVDGFPSGAQPARSALSFSTSVLAIGAPGEKAAYLLQLDPLRFGEIQTLSDLPHLRLDLQDTGPSAMSLALLNDRDGDGASELLIGGQNPETTSTYLFDSTNLWGALPD